MGMHHIGMHLTGVYIIGVYLTGVYLNAAFGGPGGVAFLILALSATWQFGALLPR